MQFRAVPHARVAFITALFLMIVLYAGGIWLVDKEIRQRILRVIRAYGPRLRFSGFARSADYGREDEPVSIGKVAGPAGRILLAGKITPHRRLDEQDDEAILGFVADLRDGLPEKILLLRRELTQSRHR